MTVSLVKSYVTTNVNIGEGDQLIVTSSGSIVETSENVAVTGQANSLLDVEGFVLGFTGVDDAFGNGTIAVAIGGSVIGLTDDAIVMLGVTNFISNFGLIESDLADALVFGSSAIVSSNNNLTNDGTIYGLGDGCLFYNGDEYINNSGTISCGAAYSVDECAIIIDGGGYNAINNNGLISTTVVSSFVINILGNGNVLTNNGTISGGYEGVNFGNGGDSISNSGTISAYSSAIVVAGALGNSNIYNTGVIESTTNFAISFDGGGDDSVHNVGKITGGITFAGVDDSLNNSGTIIGRVQFNSDDDIFSNSGTVSGVVAFASANDAFDNSGTVDGSVGFKFNAGSFLNTGTITDGIIFQGGDGLVINAGSIHGSAVFEHSVADFQNSGTLFGQVVFVADGAEFINTGVVDADIFFQGNSNYFDGNYGEVVGTLVGSGTVGWYTGGADGMNFQFAVDDLLSTQTIVGGASVDDSLTIVGNGVLTAHDLKHISGIETIDLTGKIQIAISEKLADTAAAHALTIIAQGDDTVDLSKVTSATDQITVQGGNDNVIIAGASRDIFDYSTAGASTGSDYNTISGVNFAHDFFDVSDASGGDILKLKTAITTGALSSGAGFDASLATDIGMHLGAHDAVLFTASSGTLAHHTFLLVDCNGTAGYQAGQDLVIDVTGAKGTLTLANLI